MRAKPPNRPPTESGIPVPRLDPCPKHSGGELDRVCPPGETVRAVTARLQAAADKGLPVLGALRRLDTDRLNIPVCMSLAGDEAFRVLPDRRQMGKGASQDQAEASALMELVERYSFYSFWERLPRMSGLVRGTWSEARAQCGDSLLDLEEILQSVHDVSSPGQLRIARQLFDLMPWTFAPALHLGENRIVRVPLEWFRMIGEFNGCSAGNTATESILHGVCELIERHVCSVVARGRATCPSIRTDDVRDPVLRSLLDTFGDANIHLLLKDFSLDMPVPTVTALAVDPSTFPVRSEIVFTAGTATSPARAAIRALTEAAQLGGDFCTSSCYEPSGLPKYGNRHETQWLESGRSVRLADLPDASAPDMLDELLRLTAALRQRNIQMYSLEMTHPELEIPVHYTLAPGLDFLQRDVQDGVGLFIGRRLAEEAPPDVARRGLEVLGRLIPENVYLQFFRGLLSLRAGDAKAAGEQFAIAGSVQRSPDREAMIAYYGAYSHVVREDWYGALPWLDRAISAAPAMSESWSLRGICRFRLGDYASAAENFKAALRRNKGSAPDLANLGACLMELDDAEQATACLASALSMDPDLAPARQRLDQLTSAAV